ncbi:MAG TPA: hypothetical protein VNB64_10915 [Solirubrobacteraceae bacterium]|nr:hypothetical protein [Solirubrobacteraceae bacterium]
MSQPEDLAALLAEGGAVVAGGAALVGTSFFVVASLARDVGIDIDPLGAAERGGQIGGALGFAALIWRLTTLD